jgi:aldose 1-epimerase
MTAESLRLATGDASVEIVPAVGGAIASFRHAGRDVLRPTPGEAREAANVRQFACYPLVPYSNRIAHARLSVGDAHHDLARNFGEHPHSIHGLGWQRAWNVGDADAARALLTLEHAPSTDWPFAFRATQSFTISRHGDASMLTLTLGMRNIDERAFPCGLGWHPFFPRATDTELAFEARGRWDTDDTRLPTSLAALDAASTFASPRAVADARLDNVFAGWSGHASIASREAGSRTTLEADSSLAFLVVFVPDDRAWFAVEPVTHMTDAFNRFAAGATDTGTVVLASGASRSCTMRILAQPY